MQQGKCDDCGREQPLGAMFHVYQSLLCEPCANGHVLALDKKQLPPGTVRHAIDMTVCTECNADGGDQFHELIGSLPFCPDCAARVRHRHFPLWLKAAVILLLALAGIAAYRMAGYTRAAMDLHRSFRLAFVQGDMAGAQKAAEAAKKQVPASKYTRAYSYYFTGLKAFIDDDMAQAYSCLNAIDIPLEENIFKRNYLLRKAQIGLAFDKQQYERALAMSQEDLKADPDNPIMLTSVASISAACYAQSGDNKRKQETLEVLNRVSGMLSKVPAAEQAQLNYEIKRIMHRLESRQIMSRKDYEKKFGQRPGFTPGKEKSQS